MFDKSKLARVSARLAEANLVFPIAHHHAPVGTIHRWSDGHSYRKTLTGWEMVHAPGSNDIPGHPETEKPSPEKVAPNHPAHRVIPAPANPNPSPAEQPKAAPSDPKAASDGKTAVPAPATSNGAGGWDLRGHMAFEHGAKPGDEVEARWTNSHFGHAARAEVLSNNESSMRVRTLHHVTTAGGQLPAGSEIVLPKMTFKANSKWSHNNGAFPTDAKTPERDQAAIDARAATVKANGKASDYKVGDKVTIHYPVADKMAYAIHKGPEDHEVVKVEPGKNRIHLKGQGSIDLGTYYRRVTKAGAKQEPAPATPTPTAAGDPRPAWMNLPTDELDRIDKQHAAHQAAVTAPPANAVPAPVSSDGEDKGPHSVHDFMRRRRVAGMSTSYPLYVVHPEKGTVWMHNETDLKQHLARGKAAERAGAKGPSGPFTPEEKEHHEHLLKYLRKEAPYPAGRKVSAERSSELFRHAKQEHRANQSVVKVTAPPANATPAATTIPTPASTGIPYKQGKDEYSGEVWDRGDTGKEEPVLRKFVPVPRQPGVPLHHTHAAFDSAGRVIKSHFTGEEGHAENKAIRSARAYIKDTGGTAHVAQFYAPTEAELTAHDDARKAAQAADAHIRHKAWMDTVAKGEGPGWLKSAEQLPLHVDPKPAWLPQEHHDAIVRFAQTMRDRRFAAMVKDGMTAKHHAHRDHIDVKYGRTYANVDRAGSGKHMIALKKPNGSMSHLEPGDVVGIKGYGVPHPGYRSGNVLNGTADPGHQHY